MTRKIVVITLILIFCTNTLFAQIGNSQTITKTGTTAAAFLKIAPDPRAAAMGNAFIAIPGDLSSMHWNPAGLDHITRSEVLFVNNKWLADIDYLFMAMAVKLPSIGTVGISATSLSIPQDLVRTEIKPDGTGEYWSAQDLSLTLSISRRLTDRFSIGGNAKFISERIWHESSANIALDFGTLYDMPIGGIRLAGVLSNYGPKMGLSGRDLYFSSDPDPINSGTVTFVNSEYQTDDYPLPLVFRVGLSGELFENQKVRLTWAADALHPNDNLESVNLGAELGLAETVFLRAGWSSLFLPDTEEGLTLGAGLNYRIGGSQSILKVNYSYSDHGRLKSVQRFSLGLAF